MRFLVRFIVTPILIRGLGEVLYGAWMMIQHAVSWLSIGDFRSMSTLKFTLAIRQHVENDDEKRRQVGAALFIWGAILPLMIILGTALIIFAPKIIQVPAEQQSLLRLSMGIMVAGGIVNRLLALPSNVLVGCNLHYKAFWVEPVKIILSGVLMVGAIKMGWSLSGVAGGFVLSTIVGGVFFFQVARKFVPWFGAKRPDSKLLRYFLRYTAWIFLSGLAWTFLTGSDVLLLGFLAGPAVVTVYTTTAAAARMTMEVLNRLSGASKAGIAGLCGEESWEVIESLRLEMQIFSITTITVAGCGVLVLNPAFLNLWIGEGFFLGQFANLMIVLACYFTLLFMVDNQILHGMLDFRNLTLLLSVGGIVLIGLGTPLTGEYGAVGMATALAISRLCAILISPIIISRKTGKPAAVYFREILRPVLVSGLFLAAAYQIPIPAASINIIEFILYGVAITCITPALFIALGLQKEQRVVVLRRLSLAKRVLSKR